MEQIAGFSLSLSLSLSFHCHLHKFKERRDVDQLYTCQRPVHVNGGVSMGILLSNGPIFPNIFGYSYHIMPNNYIYPIVSPNDPNHTHIVKYYHMFPFPHPGFRPSKPPSRRQRQHPSASEAVKKNDTNPFHALPCSY